MAELQTEEEQLEALQRFWQNYGWWLSLLAVLGLAVYLGMNYVQDRQTERAQAASELFEDYLSNIDDSARSETLLGQLENDYAGTAYHVLSLLQRAQRAVGEEDVDTAVGFYQEAAVAADSAALRDLANLRLARAQLQLAAYDQALATLASVESAGYRSLVAELKGDVHAARQEPVEAREAYQAALDSAAEGSPRPILEMKIASLPASE